MQSVSAAFTAEEKDSTRAVVGSLLVSWKKETNLSARTFTIGVSSIGGGDIIGINPGAVGGPGIYHYFDESDYLLSLAWERSLNMPIGGLTTALAEARLENTSMRFTPRYMGGQSELFTSILPRRPIIINAGFVGDYIPQFAGILTRQPQLDTRTRTLSLEAADYMDFFQNRFLDQEVMFTGLRTDEVLEDLFQSMGMSTAQYELDPGINVIPFGLFEKGTRFSNIINDLVQAEIGHIYQDEEGKFRFENRYHWDSSPHNAVQRVLLTGQVLEAEAPNDDHIINVVEVNSKIVTKQPEQSIFRLSPFDFLEIPASSNAEFFIDFESPALSMTTPTASGEKSYYVANSASDGSGTNLTGSVSVVRVDRFAHAAKLHFSNASTSTAYITSLVVSGRVARTTSPIYVRSKTDSSITAYEERPYRIENDYIQSEIAANSLAQMILTDFSQPENLQRITIRAIPSLQLGDLVSWQGRYWRIFNIGSTLNPSEGFVQRLTLLQRTLTSYFRIGISTIGGTDGIAP